MLGPPCGLWISARTTEVPLGVVMVQHPDNGSALSAGMFIVCVGTKVLHVSVELGLAPINKKNSSQYLCFTGRSLLHQLHSTDRPAV